MKRNPPAFNLFVIGTLALATAAGAAEKRTLTLEQCLELGLANSKGLHASQMAVEASAEKLKEVTASRLPSLKFSANYTRLSEVPPFEVNLPFAAAPSGSSTFVVSPSYFNNYTLKLGFQQPLFTGFRLQAG
ncbi:MAG: TolC family protein, partial [Candidatus Aminicenantales bacterium]